MGYCLVYGPACDGGQSQNAAKGAICGQRLVHVASLDSIALVEITTSNESQMPNEFLDHENRSAMFRAKYLSLEILCEWLRLI